MADLRIVLQLPNGDQPMDIDDDEEFEGEDNSGGEQQGQQQFSTIGCGIMAFNDYSLPSPLDVTTPEELLTPLARLRSFAASDNIFNRRMIAHDACNVLESLRNDDVDFEAGIQCYLKLSEDLEPSVRVELMEQISEITERFHIKILDSAVIPILLRYLTDVNNQVRKTCHSVLVDITRRGYMEIGRFEKDIMPLLQDLTSRRQAPDEYRTEAIALICQICEAFGSEFAKQHFLPIFLESCRDETIFHIRKVCAANFSSFCDIFDDSLINEDLLPRFVNLCKDNVWGVRKSCAESFPDFARHTSEEIRIGTLSPIFSGLLSDQSRWVRVAAFESLGPFISTFADSKNANLNQASPDGKSANQDPDVKSDFDSFLYWREPIPPVTFNEDFDDLTVFEGTDAEEEIFIQTEESEEIHSQVYVNSGTPTHHKEEDKPGDNVTAQASEMTVIIPTAELNRMPAPEQPDENEYSPTKEDIFKSVEFSADKENIPIDFDIKLDDEVTPDEGQGQQNSVADKEIEDGPKNNADSVPVVPKTASEDSELNHETTEYEYDNPSVPSISLTGDSAPVVTNTESATENLEPSHDTTERETDSLSSVPAITLTTPGGNSDDEMAVFDDQSEAKTTETGGGDSELGSGDSPIKNEIVGEEKVSQYENQDGSDSGDSDDDFFDENEPRNWQTPNLQDYSELYDADSNDRCEIDYRIFSSSLSDISYARADRIHHDPFDSISAPSMSKPSIQQNVIPQPLLDNFLSMTDPSRKQTVDTEISKHCAYSLPGVAYTLGRNNWHCLKEVYQKLATDVQWKVRRTIASSIHELAKILGEELTATELVPIFNGFLKDLDDVRIGVLRHLADFLKLLNPKVRGVYLYQLTDFLTIDNSRNWRFRYELARQLSFLVDLYDGEDIVKYVCPIAMRLAADRVVAVQEEAARLIATLLTKLHEDNSGGNHFEVFATRINTEIAKSPKWKERTLYSKICYLILKEVFLPFSTFLRFFSAPLVELASDKIVNVRILTAKALSYAANTFCEEGEGDEMCAAVKELKNDKDRDVRFNANA